MKKLSFRLYDPQTRLMHYAQHVPEAENMDLFGRAALDLLPHTSELQLDTGLLDMDGNPIFEADVLRFHNPAKRRPAAYLVVMWFAEKAAFGYRDASFDPAKGRFWPETYFAEWHELQTDLLAHCRVVGLAHERPDWALCYEYKTPENPENL